MDKFKDCVSLFRYIFTSILGKIHWLVLDGKNMLVITPENHTMTMKNDLCSLFAPKMDSEEWERIYIKSKHIFGLYLYKDKLMIIKKK